VLVGCDGIHSVVRQAVFPHSGTWSLGGLPYAEMRDIIPALVREVHDRLRRSDRILEELKDFARPHAQEAPTVPLALYPFLNTYSFQATCANWKPWSSMRSPAIRGQSCPCTALKRR
jgi:2-polyprenyl-6-methoxyphenol hydroxylase-like FAD-dependent oxidoreductase